MFVYLNQLIMAGIKSLAKDTAIYGMSSIIGKFLNWCLTPLYTYLLVPAEYGIVVYLYAPYREHYNTSSTKITSG